MAGYTETVPVKQGAALKKAEPNTRDNSSSIYVLDYLSNLDFNAYAVFSFSEFPMEYRKKKINGVSIKAKIKRESPQESRSARFIPIYKPFNQDTVVYYDHPYNSGWEVYSGLSLTSEFKWVEAALNTYQNDIKKSKEYLYSLFQNGIKLDPNIDCITSVYSQNSSDAPYVNLSLEDYAPKTANESPSSGFVDNNKSNVFSWGIEEIFSYDEIKQSSAKFRWRTKGAPQYTEVSVSGSTQSITIPAGTFNADEIEWQVIVTSDDGIEGIPSDWFALTTVDSKSSAKAVSPVNVVVDGSFPVEFKWNHIIDTGSDQTKYELEYSSNNGTSWESLQSESTKNTYATVPANTLPAGNLLWKVRTYNTDNVAGDWSEPVQFIVRAAPSAPSITSISAEARPLVRWQSVGQQAYEVAVYSGDTLIYKTGETAGTEKERKIQEYLAPGSYTVKVRIWNAYNIESPWGSGFVLIPENGLEKPVVNAAGDPGFVTIQASGMNFVRFYLLRDGVPIAESKDGRFTDYAVSAGNHVYIVRGITAADEFADSEPREIEVSIPYAMVAPVDNLAEWVPMIYRRNADPNWTENIQVMGEAIFAAGRSLPFFEFSEFCSNALSFVYSYRTREEYDRIKNLLIYGKTVRYRGKDGAAYWMALTGLQTNTDHMSRDFTLSAQEVDFVEKIEYQEE